MKGETTMSAIVNVAIIYYSSTGNVYRLARAAADAAEAVGAEVRLRKVRELAPPESINSNPQWAAHAEATRDILEATPDDLEWADVVLFGTPTRYGNMAAQLKQFIDRTGKIWQQGKLANKVYSAFTSTATEHGGQESTLLSLANTFYHWGGILVPPGYTDPVQFRLGNPYGTSHVARTNDGPGEAELATVSYQVRRAVDVAASLKAGRAASEVA